MVKVPCSIFSSSCSTRRAAMGASCKLAEVLDEVVVFMFNYFWNEVNEGFVHARQIDGVLVVC